MHSILYLRLSAMMFLQFFVWGAWYVTVGNYMKALGMESSIFWAYTVGPLTALISPFLLGIAADRFFATEKVFGVLHLIAGGLMFCAPLAAEGKSASVTGFILILLLYMFCYTPTIGLSNALVFHQIKNQEKQFPLIRVFGTIGWIVAGVLVSKVLHADETAIPLRVAAVAGVALGVFSFTLPHTPPPAAGRTVSMRSILGWDALKELSSFPFLVFMVCSLLVSVVCMPYYPYSQVFVKQAGIENPAYVLSFGQMSEALFIVLMPWFFLRLGVKWMLVGGMLAWTLRYVLFAYAAADAIFWMILVGILLHGICYDFFFVTGFIYVDKKCSPAIRSQAQGLLVLVTVGLGNLAGAQAGGWWYNRTILEAASAHAWKMFWIVLAALSGLVTLLFVALFKNEAAGKTKAPAAAEASDVRGVGR
jgi:nucleoside transporter